MFLTIEQGAYYIYDLMKNQVHSNIDRKRAVVDWSDLPLIML